MGGLAGLVAPYKSEALTPAEAQPLLLAQLERDSADGLLRQNLTAMQMELFKKAAKKEEARAYVEKACQDFHLKRYSTPGMHTEEEVINDLKSGRNELNLKALFDAAQHRPFFDPEARRERTFTARLFADRLFDPRMGLYVLMSLPGQRPYSGEEVFFWRSEDKTPVSPPNRAAVAEKVKRAWYFDKARQVTRARAVEIAKKINGAGAAERLADVQASDPQRYGKVFELEDMAKLWRPKQEPLHAGLYEYRPYSVPEDKIDLFPYAQPDLVKQLLALKKKGDTMVVVDAPARTFYVAVLESRNDRLDLKDFFTVYKDSRHAQLWRLFDEDRAKEYRKTIVEQLRREAVGADKLDKDGKYIIAQSVRERFEGQAGREEE
jgi:hypothetical protein